MDSWKLACRCASQAGSCSPQRTSKCTYDCHSRTGVIRATTSPYGNFVLVLLVVKQVVATIRVHLPTSDQPATNNKVSLENFIWATVSRIELNFEHLIPVSQTINFHSVNFTLVFHTIISSTSLSQSTWFCLKHSIIVSKIESSPYEMICCGGGSMWYHRTSSFFY